MDIKKIDTNFLQNASFDEEKTTLYEVQESPFSLYGIRYDETQKAFARMPSGIANDVSDGVGYLSRHTAGGRVRFSTDSKTLTLLVQYDGLEAMPHMATSGCCGFSLCKNEGGKEIFSKGIFPLLEEKTGFVRKVELPCNGVRSYTLYFPLYQSVKSVYIGLDKGAFVGEGVPYEQIAPIVYYGSSITQGGCASRADTSYQGFICKRNNVDFINLGFSGNAMAERQMIEYLSGLPCSVFVFDYDHNAPTTAYLKATHYRAYRRYREKNPHTPVVFISRPNSPFEEETLERLEIIQESYAKGKAEGDENLYLIDGRTLLASEWENSTVDGCHPTDLGFYQMSLKIGETIDKILQIKK